MDVKPAYMKANYHTHTRFCDGEADAETMVRAAMEKGFEVIGFSGHVDIAPKMDIPAYQKEIRRLEREYAGRIKILCGGEMDSLYPERNVAGLEYVIGSVHHLRAADGTPLAVDWDVQAEKLLRETYGGDGYRMCRDYYRQVAEAWGGGGCTWIGHFDLVARYNGEWRFVDEEDPRYLGPAYEAMEVLAARGLPMEINTKQVRRGRIYPGRTLLRRWKALGGEILLSSDAHRPEDLDLGFAEAAAMAVECGFDHVNLLRRGDGGIGFVQAGLG